MSKEDDNPFDGCGCDELELPEDEEINPEDL